MREHQSTKIIFDKLIKQTDAAHITKIHFAVGEMSAPAFDVIESHWNELSIGTPLEQAQLHFRLITAEAQCMACFKKYHPVNGIIHCPNCGSVGAKILSGEEFYVEHIETNEE